MDSGTLAAVGSRLGVTNQAHTSQLTDTAEESEHTEAAIVAGHANLDLNTHLLDPFGDIVYSSKQLLEVTGTPHRDIEGLIHFVFFRKVGQVSQSQFFNWIRS